jgi:hypothetical protein
MVGPKKLGETLGEFNVFEPLTLGAPEERGDMSYMGKPLKYIPVRGIGKSAAAAGIDAKLKRLIESSWQRAKPKDGATRGNATAGAHRVVHPSIGLSSFKGATFSSGSDVPSTPSGGQPKMPPLPPRPGQQPAPPMVQQYRSANPVGYDQAMKMPGAKTKLTHLMTEVPKDWSLMQTLPNVAAYAFRGDTRAPQAIRQANGFQAPISRTDDHYLYGTVLTTFNAWLKAKLGIELTKSDFSDLLKKAMPDAEERLIFSFYEMWRGQVAAESLHVGRMVANETLKGYVSTTRAPTVAKGFAKNGGHVYVLRVRCGFLVPPKGAHPWTQIFGEEEIASPRAIEWDDVVGFRAVGPGNLFTGPVMLRMGLMGQDSNAFDKALRALSGKHDI